MSKDVHTEHCCIIHGCKYSDPSCTVVIGKERQSYPCEICSDQLNDKITEEFWKAQAELSKPITETERSLIDLVDRCLCYVKQVNPNTCEYFKSQLNKITEAKNETN